MWLCMCMDADGVVEHLRSVLVSVSQKHSKKRAGTGASSHAAAGGIASYFAKAAKHPVAQAPPSLSGVQAPARYASRSAHVQPKRVRSSLRAAAGAATTPVLRGKRHSGPRHSSASSSSNRGGGEVPGKGLGSGRPHGGSHAHAEPAKTPLLRRGPVFADLAPQLFASQDSVAYEEDPGTASSEGEVEGQHKDVANRGSHAASPSDGSGGRGAAGAGDDQRITWHLSPSQDGEVHDDSDTEVDRYVSGKALSGKAFMCMCMCSRWAGGACVCGLCKSWACCGICAHPLFFLCVSPER